MHILKQLSTKKGRDEAGLFSIEGEKFISEIPHNVPVKRYIISQSYAEMQAGTLPNYKARAPVEIIADKIFARYADTQTPQGIAAICEKPAPAQLSDFSKKDIFLLFCENVQDPGNIGTLIRTAAAAGAHGIILSNGCADMYNPKTLRATAGAAFRLPIITDISTMGTLPRLKAQGIALYAAHPHDGNAPYNIDMKKGLCILIGNEAHGLSNEALRLADARLCLPMAQASESLNASAAGSILLYEVLRQRSYC
ncbi:MAG: RNA methyltransferase [Defluviitaleaceae bacterium]|nr:RNA methyltransferase [Defluviitaleaceae bacterium]MCL2275669.1 RNA methyltransferase [Defluviitaleaceae bacterium]